MPHGQKFRNNARFVMDMRTLCSRLDRNAKAKLLHKCEVLERSTKRKGRRNGVIGVPGLTVLRSLLLRFHGPSGVCCPSYTTLQRTTGLCRQSIATALLRLESVGVLRVTRRLQRVAGICRQTSNAYSFSSMPRLVFVSRVYVTGGRTTQGLSGEKEERPTAKARSRAGGDAVGGRLLLAGEVGCLYGRPTKVIVA